ncbi:MAG: carboxyl-terminal processing protease [Parcubacteria bacterium C7867-004]|nr:MAG: carboxyl-terminal processing protease [Parcubacteria bacterium C7867-004]
MDRETDTEFEVTEARSRSFASLVKLGVAFAVILVVGFVGGMTVNANTASKIFAKVPILGDGLDATPDESADLSSFWKAWNALDAQFVETHASSTLPGTKEKLWGAIAGLTASYGDPYTTFFPPAEAKVFQDDIKGNFGGVGMEIGIKDGVLIVIAPLKGTPADKAGFRSGDAIISIDGKSTEGLSSDEAVKLIRGEKGTTVTITIFRDAETIKIPVVRDTINVPTIDNSLDAKSGVYTIALYSFTANSGQLFSKALAEFRASGSDKLIIDLRGDPGGYLESAVQISSMFLPKGTTVVTEDYKGKQENIVHRSTGRGGVPEGTKVVILIDQGSASASEILAGALQDEKKATLVGTRSFGKGSVQELVDIDGGALKVTVARWLTPAGRSISDGGLTPDIKVERTKADYDAGKDPQKARAIEFLTTGK